MLHCDAGTEAAVHYRRAAEALRSELHACVGEAGLGAGGLAGLHRVAGDEDGGVQGAVVGVVRAAAEGAPAEGRVDAAEIAVYRTGSFDWTTADPRNSLSTSRATTSFQL